MKADERIKFTLGDLLVQNALLQSENEELKAALAGRAERPEPSLAGDDLHA